MSKEFPEIKDLYIWSETESEAEKQRVDAALSELGSKASGLETRADGLDSSVLGLGQALRDLSQKLDDTVSGLLSVSGVITFQGYGETLAEAIRGSSRFQEGTIRKRRLVLRWQRARVFSQS